MIVKGKDNEKFEIQEINLNELIQLKLALEVKKKEHEDFIKHDREMIEKYDLECNENDIKDFGTKEARLESIRYQEERVGSINNMINTFKMFT